VSLIVIPFCLSVWMSVGHPATYSLPRLIYNNQIWSAGIYLSSDPCKPFWIPYLPYFGCQREKYAKFRLFNRAGRRLMHAQTLLLRQQQGWTLYGRTVGRAMGRCSAAQRPRLLRSSSQVKVAQSADRRRRYSSRNLACLYPLVSRVFLPLRT